MNCIKNTKKILSIMVLIIFVLAMLPANVFAATVMDEDYGTMTDFSNNFGWKITTSPTHAVFQKTDGGVRILQTVQTRYAAGSTTANNITQDGSFDKPLNNVIKSDPSTGMVISSEGVKGNVKITIDYVIDQKNEGAAGTPYYPLTINGYVYLRLYNTNITVSNTSSIGSSTMSVRTLNSANGAGGAKQVVVEIDTVNEKVKVTHNGNTSEGDSTNKATGKAGVGCVKNMNLRNMQRMNVGAYLEINSIKVETDSTTVYEFDEETQKLIDNFPTSIVPDHNNVTGNVTLPVDIPGIKWTTSNKDIISKTGRISRMSATDPTQATLTGTFNLTTKSGEVVTLNVVYPLNVTGLAKRLDNTTIINPVSGATDTTEKYYTMPTRGNEEDGYPMPGDPDNISDEAFFGKWDSKTSKWVLNPYFNYSKYPAMSKIEAAAKKGDYETAKNELVEYYRSVAPNRISQVNSISEANREYYKALYELMSRNAYVTNFISNYVINTFNVGKNWADVKIDVTKRLNEAKGSYDIFTLVVASVDKYRNQTEVYSKESNYAPYIEATVNGEKRIFPVAKDATLQGGQYADTNFGSQNILYAEEAGSWATPEDRTKRMFIGFDLSGLKRDDKVENAKIVLKARHTGSDEQKMMAAYWIGESSWLENAVCWNTFADHMYFSCNDMNCWDWVTSNKTDVKGKVCGYHRDTEPATLASSYNFYSKHPELEQYPEKYAYTYLRQYLGLINSIGTETDVMNQLDMSTHISGVSADILRLMNSKYMTGEVFTAYLKHLWMLTDYHVYNWYGKAYNNFATFSTGAVYNMTERFPEFNRREIWLEETKKENNRVIVGFTFEDGMSLELAQGYTQTILSTLATPFSTSNVTGGDLPYSEETIDIIHDLVLSLFNCIGPMKGGFNLGDSYDPYGDYTAVFKNWYNYLFSDDPTIAYMAGKGGWLPDRATTNYPYGLRTYMRSDWTEDALALAITSKMDGSHGHKDSLSIAMFAYGKYLLTDQGYGSVQTGNTMYYMKSPQQHNVVTVNDSKDYIVNGYVINEVRAQSYDTVEKVDGEQKDFDTNGLYDFVEYKTSAYTTTQNSQRSVTFLKDQKFYIVTDYHIPNDPNVSNEFAQNWHLYPGAEMTIDPSTKVIESHFEDEPNVMLVPVNPSNIDKTEIRGTWYSEKGGQIANSQKGMLYTNKKGNGVFSTIIMPMDVGEDYTITTNKLTNSLSDEYINLFSFDVKNEVTKEVSKFYYYHVNEASMQTTVNVGPYTTDANTLVVEEDANGNVASVYMVDGSFVSKDSKMIMKTVDGAKDTIAFEVTDDTLEMSSTSGDIKVYEKLLFNSSLASKVNYGITKNIPYTVVDGMMTFADVVADYDYTKDPFAGEVIYDSAKNPELLNVYLNNSNEYYKATNNLATGGGIRFENIKTDPEQQGSWVIVGSLRFGGLTEDEENGTTTFSNLLTGKYAIEITLQHNITTDRVNEKGENWPTYSTMALGIASENTDGTLKAGFSSNYLELRLYNTYMNIIRYASTQADGIRNDVNNVSRVTFKPDKEWKLRMVVDTEAKNYTIFVNDVLERGAIEYPLNLKSKGNFLPDFNVGLMNANKVGSYVQVNNVKIYKIKENTDDSRLALLNSLPVKLTDGNPMGIYSSIKVPAISGVTWATSNPELIGINGVLNKKVSENTPVTFTASASLKDTEVTSRTFIFKKTYDMAVVPGEWKLTASKTDDTITASVATISGNESMVSYLVITEYDAKGKMINLKVEKVNGKLENYTYKVGSNSASSKVFLVDSITSTLPLYKNYSFK